MESFNKAAAMVTTVLIAGTVLLMGCGRDTASVTSVREPLDGSMRMPENDSIALPYSWDSREHKLLNPWVVMRNKGEPYVRVVDGELISERVLYLKSDRSSFSVNREVDIDPRTYSQLSWRWMAEILPDRGDVRQRRRNDQALQVLVYFDGGYAISYVWDTTAPVDTTTDESIPLVVSIKVLVVQSGMARVGRWCDIERDVNADFKNLFQREPSRIKAVRIQTNSQHTGSTGAGYISSLRFARPRHASVNDASN